MTLLENDPLFAHRLRGVPSDDDSSAQRVRALSEAIAAIDRATAAKLAERAPAGAKPFVQEGIVDNAVQRLVTARPDELPALRSELGPLLSQLEARCDGSDVRAVPAALRLGGESLAVRWLDAIAGGDSAPAPLDDLAQEAAQLGYRGAAAPLARIVEDASKKAASSDSWADLLGHDAASAVRALRVLDPARASALVAAAPAALRQRFE